MEENSKLNNKYQKIDVDKEIISETASQSPESDSSPDKGSRKKQPKEKKVKEKKVKEPKPKKEKKVKEPKPEKPKKEKKEKAPKEPKPPKEKKIKEPKVPKEKKVKEPKPPKVKKEKPPKVKKEKAPKPEKVKKVKEPKEKKPREPLKTKDFVTIGVAVLALLLIAGIFALKHFSETGAPENPTGTNNAEIDKMAEIQVAREGVGVNLVQSDIPAVFYGFSADYKLQYYQFINGKMVPVKSTGTVTALVDMGNETLPVTINYVELGDRIFGIGLFRADRTNDVYFYDKVVFKLTNLPKSFKESGKALLLASIGDSAVTKKDVMWSESFTLDLATGATSRFLKIINRTIDMNGAGVQDFCMLPEAGYKAQSSFVPFITAREYEADSGKQDIFIKQGAKETLFASDVYGKFFLTEGETVTFMRKTTTGFDVVKKTGETEEKVRSYYGYMSSDYLHYGEYILGKNDGKLYHIKTGAEKTLVGYRMTPEMMCISPDGRYLVMLGTVNSAVDYQVHIFNLETGSFAKYVDKNYSNHFNLTFVDGKTAVYAVLDPNQGFEYVALDVTKAK